MLKFYFHEINMEISLSLHPTKHKPILNQNEKYQDFANGAVLTECNHIIWTKRLSRTGG
jgi:hypothetical protein